MGIFIYKFYNEKTVETKKSKDLQAQVDSLNRTVSDLQEKINSISETLNTNISIENEIQKRELSDSEKQELFDKAVKE